MKKITAVVLLIAMIMSFCSCSASSKSKQKQTDILEIEMDLNVLMVLEDYHDSNYAILEALGSNSHGKMVEKFELGVEEIYDTPGKIEVFLPETNCIEENTNKLILNYQETIQLLQKSNLSNDEKQNLLTLLDEGTHIQRFLMEIVQSFSNLYSIRFYDQLPDDKAKKVLKEKWDSFRFEDLECPETIEKQELYLIWAKQFAKENFEPTEQFMKDLDELRMNDDLASKEYNQKWLDFIEKYMIDTSSTETWGEDSTQVYFFDN